MSNKTIQMLAIAIIVVMIQFFTGTQPVRSQGFLPSDAAFCSTLPMSVMKDILVQDGIVELVRDREGNLKIVAGNNVYDLGNARVVIYNSGTKAMVHQPILNTPLYIDAIAEIACEGNVGYIGLRTATYPWYKALPLASASAALRLR